MAFVTSERRVGTRSLHFTDLALLRLGARRSFADWLEVFAGAEFLPKQPVDSDASLWQGAHLGAQAEFAPGFGASLGGTVGPLLAQEGLWWQSNAELAAKFAAAEFTRFSLHLGNAWTFLDFDDSAARAFWLAEVTSGAEVQVGDDKASMWVALDYDVPFASSPDRGTPDPMYGFIDPQPRLDLEVGGALSFGPRDWAVFASYRFVDRGELEKPETMLPILDGGFDQRQAIVGVEYRFTPKPKRDPDWEE